jgi:hypothetical protein
MLLLVGWLVGYHHRSPLTAYHHSDNDSDNDSD